MDYTELDGYEYEDLYARYINANVDEFFRLADVKGKRVLDLCSGSGVLARKSVEMGAITPVVAVDASDMMMVGLKFKTSIKTIAATVQEFLEARWAYGPKSGSEFDVVFCRQAVNYWMADPNVDLGLLKKIMAERSVFVFNTFNEKPSETPRIREYEFNWANFIEVSYLVGDTVHHIQATKGMKPHMTSFKWISREDFMRILAPHFDVEVHTRGKTDMYVCRPRKESK